MDYGVNCSLGAGRGAVFYPWSQQAEEQPERRGCLYSARQMAQKMERSYSYGNGGAVLLLIFNILLKCLFKVT